MYQSKLGVLPGTSYAEVIKAARREYRAIQQRTPRRQPYIRSKYFKHDKIFINLFWAHLNQKVRPDRLRRLKLFGCAIDVIRNCLGAPETMQNPNKPDEALHRYKALTKDGLLFYVQIRENKITGRKDFMSTFPAK
jgi:hypothetical protein